jgi:hypothetical protein
MKKIVLDSGAALLSRQCDLYPAVLCDDCEAKQVARRALSSPRGISLVT